ncbi:MAG: transglycosylase SLT domain-containing protein, partial [bacterium]
KSILLKLSKRKNLSVVKLQGKERSIALLFGKNLNSKRLRRAANKIRAQNGLKERFKQGLVHSGLYMSQMREVFLEAGLPIELLVLPHVESSFNYKAYSKFGAAGIWQFTRSTGRHYMKISYAVDERLDPIRATESAAKLLKHNYQTLGSWPLAITAYNHGLYGMKRAIRKHGHDLGRIVKYYRSRSFGFASSNFYAEFLAALHITNNYKAYFGEIEFHKPKDYIIFETPDYITVKTLIDFLEIEPEEFAELNPALRTPALKSMRRIPRHFKIRIPMRENLNLTELYAKISPQFKFDEQVRPEWHKVRSGERLSIIARKYRVSLKDLMAVNNIDNPHLIYAGQNLQIPASNRTSYKSSMAAVKVKETGPLVEASDLKKDKTTILDVPRSIRIEHETDEIEPKAGPTIAAIDREVFKLNNVDYVEAKSSIKTDTIMEQNKRLSFVEVQEIEAQVESLEDEMALALPDYYVELTKSMDTRVVRIPYYELEPVSFHDIEFPENGQVQVEPDETLGHFADWLAVPTQKIRTINGLAYNEAIRIGQPLWLTFEKVTPEEFHRRRLEYHQGIEEDFYRNFSVEGDKLYKIRRGENIWIVCNRIFEIPYWLVKKYNPQKNLLQLVANEEIVIPIVEAKYHPSGLLDE